LSSWSALFYISFTPLFLAEPEPFASIFSKAHLVPALAGKFSFDSPLLGRLLGDSSFYPGSRTIVDTQHAVLWVARLLSQHGSVGRCRHFSCFLGKSFRSTTAAALADLASRIQIRPRSIIFLSPPNICAEFCSQFQGVMGCLCVSRPKFSPLMISMKPYG
jgi:hypothetical protein